ENLDERGWTLRFGMQTDGDDATVLDASELWTQRADAPGVVGRNVLNRRVQFLEELNRAGEIYPELRRALAEAGPSQLALNTMEAHVFIRPYAPNLQEREFEVA